MIYYSKVVNGKLYNDGVIMKSINEKIKNERELAGLTQKELAIMAGYENYQTLLKIEKGKRDIKVSDLSRIAKALNLSTDYFINDNPNQSVSVLWRDKKNKTACRIFENKLKGYLQNYYHLKEFMKEEYDKFIPESAKKLQSNYQAELNTSKYKFSGRLASDFRKRNDLGDYPAGSLINIIKDMGILVFIFNLKDAGSAASIVNESGAAILINDDSTPWRRNFDIAHELFHILTWNMYDFSGIDNNLTEKDNEEHYADAFAASLLMPKSSVLRLVEKYSQNNKTIDDRFVLENALKFQVSVDAFINRLEFLKVILNVEKQELLKQNIKQDFWKRFNDTSVIPNEDEYPVEYLMLVYSSYKKQKVSKMKFAEYLNKNIGEIDYYLKQRSLLI